MSRQAPGRALVCPVYRVVAILLHCAAVKTCWTPLPEGADGLVIWHKDGKIRRSELCLEVVVAADWFLISSVICHHVEVGQLPAGEHRLKGYNGSAHTSRLSSQGKAKGARRAAMSSQKI